MPMPNTSSSLILWINKTWCGDFWLKDQIFSWLFKTDKRKCTRAKKDSDLKKLKWKRTSGQGQYSTKDDPRFDSRQWGSLYFFQRSIRVEPDSPQGLSVWHPSGRWAGSVGLTQSVASEAPGGEESFGEEKKLWQFYSNWLEGEAAPLKGLWEHSFKRKTLERLSLVGKNVQLPFSNHQVLP